MMFFLKAFLMMVLPFYRVDLNLTSFPQKITYQIFVNGQLQNQLLLDSNQTKILKKVLETEKGGWKYDLASYVPSRRYIGEEVQINIVGNLVVVNDKELGQLSKEFRAIHLNNLDSEIEKYREQVNLRISKEGKYEVRWIDFDTEFFTPTDFSNFEERVQRRFKANSNFLDKMFEDMKKKCNRKLDVYEPHVLIKSPEGKELIITQFRVFITLQNECDYPKHETEGAIEELEKALLKSIREKKNVVPNYAPIFN